MRIVCLQHVPYEGPGHIAAWAGAAGHELSRVLVYEGDPAPGPEAGDALVIMGGPMGVHELSAHPWLKAEKRALDAWLNAGRPVLGVCLGAQLIADVLGAPVQRNPVQEIGWFPIRRLPQISATFLDGVLPQEMPVFHWHGDTFAIPRGAIPIASSLACMNQGFVYRDRVVGLQFHLEMDLATAQALVAASSGLRPSATVQSAEAMLADPARFEALKPRMFELLDAWSEP